MEKKCIEAGEYSQLTELIYYNDSIRFDVNKIVDIFEYLKDKKVRSCDYRGKVNIIKNAHLDFLKIALSRMYFVPKYNQATEDFLKSDYLSRELKKEIYNTLKSNCCSKQLMKLLNSEKQMNDFSMEEIIETDDSLHKTYCALSRDNAEQKCSAIYNIFKEYFFVLDGEGPINYIKDKYREKLPILMLEMSSVSSHASYYSGYGVDRSCLGEDHLFSIYKKFVKYYPDKAEEFINMVRHISKLTPTEFVSNYLLFVRNGLDSNFQNKEGNISIADVYDLKRDLVGAVSMLSLFGNEQSDIDKRYELDEEISIRNRFTQMIEQFKSFQESEQSKTYEGNNVKVLSKEIKRD